jgi:energy-coupling factor transporter ATP-binding protein EcfA2
MKDEQEISSGLNYYQNANADAVAIKAEFLVRQYEYGVILEDLVRHPGKGSVQHYLLLGRRGSGKSTLLKRLQVEIDTDEDLSSWYIAINPAEEQANIYRLFDLLGEVAKELECRQLEIDWPDDEDPTVYTRNLFSAIHHALDTAGKKLVLLLDNIDRIFESLGEDTAVLRAYLQNNDDIKIIGGSTRMTEHFWSYNQSFYEFFRVLKLQPLDSEEVRRLLLNWSDKLDAPLLREFVENKPGQLEAIRILTDGLPRTLQFFVNILLTNNQETGYDYLRLIMDKVTPLYQERLNNLPPSQRKIVLQMAFYWEAAGAGELAKATRMENRVISAQLGQLIEKGVAEKVETRTKNHLYRLSERFFNLWLIFTQGSSQEKRRAKYLTIFLENFYEEKELRAQAQKHLHSLYSKDVSSDKAYLLTKAFSQSKFITSFMRDLLVGATLELEGVKDNLKRELPDTIANIFDEVIELMVKNNMDKARSLVGSIEQEDGIKEYLEGSICMAINDLPSAQLRFGQSFQKGFILASGSLGSVFEKLSQNDEAEKYYQIAFESGLPNAPYKLCFYYYNNNKRKKESLGILEAAIQYDAKENLLALLPVLKVWNGIFAGVDEDMGRLIRDNNPDLEISIANLLAHHQVGLVQRLFESQEFGKALKDQFLSLYYTAQLLGADSKAYTIKIPPEISETVKEYVLAIYQERDFYYGTDEAHRFLVAAG